MWNIYDSDEGFYESTFRVYAGEIIIGEIILCKFLVLIFQGNERAE
jgi:hypothetical protein